MLGLLEMGIWLLTSTGTARKMRSPPRLSPTAGLDGEHGDEWWSWFVLCILAWQVNGWLAHVYCHSVILSRLLQFSLSSLPLPSFYLSLRLSVSLPLSIASYLYFFLSQNIFISISLCLAFSISSLTISHSDSLYLFSVSIHTLSICISLKLYLSLPHYLSLARPDVHSLQ